MSLSDSMFLVEITVEELRSYVRCREFLIKSQFADVFSIILKESKELDTKSTKKYPKRKTKVKRPKPLFSWSLEEPKIQTGQSILASNNIDELISNMKKYPIELSLWSIIFPDYKIASTNIAWNTVFIEYLKNINEKNYPQPISVRGDYNVFDEYTSRRMAVIKLHIKLSCLRNRISTDFNWSPIEEKETLCNVNSNTNSVLTVISETAVKLAKDIGIIKTIYSRDNKKPRQFDASKSKLLQRQNMEITGKNNDSKVTISVTEKSGVINNNVNSIISLVKSHTDINKGKEIDLIKSKSCSSMNREQLNILNYIFGSNTDHYHHVYCVGYFTVENKQNKSPESSKSSPKIDKSRSPTVTTPDFNKSVKTSDKSSMEECFKLKLCNEDCRNERINIGSCNLSTCSLDVPKHTKLVKCKYITCENKAFRNPLNPPEDKILLDLTNLSAKCCIEQSRDGNTDNKEDSVSKDKDGKAIEKLEEVVGGVKAKLQLGEDPCYCECECRFGFVKKTTYCKVCGGFESLGADHTEQRHYEMPFPCPAFHKLMDKAKTKPSATGSDSKKVAKKKSTSVKSVESEKETKKSKKKKKNNKFKFNYGYTAPHIGHSRCALPCSGTLNQVPKHMGWLWTSDNVPGMKFRPLWKPGAVNKHVLRLLKIAKNPAVAFAKKKRKKDTGKAKIPLKRPLLIVHKKDGEFTVTMETMKTYNKPRTINQVPYEDKPALTYTIGRTEEENRERRKKKERAQRRLERCQRKFIQSAFQDMCEEICLKTYQQALGILPDTEKPECTCYPAEPGLDRTDLDYSCSCSEDSKLASSDTDSDEWVVEFTPPTAKFDQSYKCKKLQYLDNCTQYTYLDYRVKLLDRYGNPVPRFFKDPDGNEQCSDLGGFWGPDNKWLEINVDGYIAPDGKWAPNIFCGPNGENVDGESGKFQAMDGTWLVVGIDGYVDSQGKWRYYPKANEKPIPKKRSSLQAAKRGAGDRREVILINKKSQGTWSCFGDVSPKMLSKMGIMGHGEDRKLLLDTLKKLIAQGEDVKIPQAPSVPRSQDKKIRGKYFGVASRLYNYDDQRRCRHAPPSDKGIVAVDIHGNKTYFKLKDYKNKRPKERIATLTDQGISISSFHVPCFHSFMSSEIMKKEQYDRLVALAKKRDENHQSNQTGHQYHQFDHHYHNIVV